MIKIEQRIISVAHSREKGGVDRSTHLVQSNIIAMTVA